jgi:hypothetical protein
MQIVTCFLVVVALLVVIVLLRLIGAVMTYVATTDDVISFIDASNTRIAQMERQCN